MSNLELIAPREPVLDEDTPIIRQPRLNLAIGPNCPVRCEGCYNNFGETASTGGTVSAEEVIAFASSIRERGIDGVTLSGGDPLFHPQIVDILVGLKGLSYRTKLDTVGTAFLEDARVIYKGRGTKPRVDIDSVKHTLESVTLPLDGTDQDTIMNFRRGRKNIFQETKAIAGLLTEAGVSFGFNTVVNATNKDQVSQIGELGLSLGAFEWHVFEYDTSGPNPSSHKDALAITPEEYEKAIAPLADFPDEGMRLDLRTKDSRVGEGAYFFVNDAGDAWSPTGGEGPVRYGHISRDKEEVLQAYDNYLEAFRLKFN